MKPRRCFLVGCAWFSLVAGLVAAMDPPSLVTRNSQACATASGDSAAPLLSADGRHLVFLSTAPNVAAQDTNTFMDVFVADVASNAVRLVSVTPDGWSGNGPCLEAAISADGSTVVFVSQADNLVAGDTNGAADVFLRDLVAGETLLVSTTTLGTAGDKESGAPSMSADGRWIAFESRATNLVANDTNKVADVFLFDRQTRTVTVLSEKSADPVLAVRAAGASTRPLLSADGTTVTFRSTSLNLAPGRSVGPYTLTNQLHYRRPLNAPVRMAPLPWKGTVNPSSSANTQPLSWDLSANGRYLAIQSLCKPASATNTIPNGVFWIDLQDDTYQLFATNRITAQLSVLPEFSGPILGSDGQTVLFEAREPFGISGLFRPVVYAWNAQTLETTRLSTSGYWDDPNIDPPSPPEVPYGELLATSADADFVAFLGGTTNDPATPLPAQQLMVLRRSTGELRRISRTQAGEPLPDVSCPGASLSSNGLFLVFESGSEQIVPGDLNRAHDVFLYDWAKDQVRLVSRRLLDHPSITGPGAANVRPGAWSADARYLVYTSLDAALAGGDTNGAPDVFRLDLVTGSNLLVSVSAAGTGTGNGASRQPVISADGRFVVFTSFATNLVEGGTAYGSDNVFLRDLDAGTTTLLSGGTATGNNNSSQPAMSADGAWIAFETLVGLDPTLDGNTLYDVYLFNRVAGSLSLVSSNAAGTAAAGGHSRQPMFSPDGHWLLFLTSSWNLIDPAPGSGWRVAAHELPSGTNRFLSTDGAVPAYGSYLPNRWTEFPVASCSADSRWALFSRGGNLALAGQELVIHDFATSVSTVVVSNATHGALSSDGRFAVYETALLGSPFTQIALADMESGATSLITAALPLGAQGGCRLPIIAPGNRFVVFTSWATNLDGVADNNHAQDVFVFDRSTTRTLRLGLTSAGAAGRYGTTSPVLAPDGRTLAFASFAPDLAESDLNQDQDLFVVRLPGPESNYRITTIQAPGAGGTTLIWEAETGRTYRLEWTTDLQAASWQPLDATVQISEGRATATDPIPASTPRRFYRIAWEP